MLFVIFTGAANICYTYRYHLNVGSGVLILYCTRFEYIAGFDLIILTSIYLGLFSYDVLDGYVME